MVYGCQIGIAFWCESYLLTVKKVGWKAGEGGEGGAPLGPEEIFGKQIVKVKDKKLDSS